MRSPEPVLLAGHRCPCPAARREAGRPPGPDAGAGCQRPCGRPPTPRTPPGSKGTMCETPPARLPTSAHPLNGPPGPRSHAQTAPPRPASPGCGCLEAPQHCRGRSRSRRWRPLRTPRGAPLAAILLSSSRDVHGQQALARVECGPGARAARFPPSCRPPPGTVENRRVPAVWGRAPRPALHAELGTRPPVTLGLPSPEEEQQSVQPAHRVPGLHLQASSCNDCGLGQSTREPRST